MGKLMFFYPVLKVLNDGSVVRRSVAIALRVLAVLFVLGGIFLSIEVLKTSFQFQTTEASFGGILFTVILLAANLACAQVLWFRADSVRDLEDSSFTVIPIVSILLRTGGEVYATLLFALGIGGCLLLWIARTSPMMVLGDLRVFLPATSVEGTFVGGVVFLLYLSFVAFVTLVGFYFLAESSVVLIDIAKNVRLMAGRGNSGADSARTGQ